MEEMSLDINPSVYLLLGLTLLLLSCLLSCLPAGPPLLLLGAAAMPSVLGCRGEAGGEEGAWLEMLLPARCVLVI